MLSYNISGDPMWDGKSVIKLVLYYKHLSVSPQQIPYHNVNDDNNEKLTHVTPNKIISLPPTNTLFQSCFSGPCHTMCSFSRFAEGSKYLHIAVPDSLEADLFSTFATICHFIGE